MEQIKQKAIIVDIDGTIAKMKRGPGQRRPYDWDRVIEDDINPPICELIDMLFEKGIKIILLTGRDESSRKGTVKWLKLHDISWDSLYMKEKGSYEASTKTKHTTYVEEIRPHFNVLFVLEDESKVVDMWRAIGLTCIQVNEGRV